MSNQIVTGTPVERRALTIAELCQAYGLSRASFYKLRKNGRGPRVTYAAGKPLILAADEAAWRDQLAQSAD